MDLFDRVAWPALTSAAFIFVSLALAARIALLLLDRSLPRLLQRSRTELDDVLFEAVRAPLFWLAIVLSANVAAMRLDFLAPEWQSLIDESLFVAGVLTIAWLAYRLVTHVLDWYARTIAVRTATRLDDVLVPYLRRLVLIVLFLLTGLTLLDHFGIEVTTLIATLGVGSLAVALAAQAVLRDAISGLLILFDRPYHPGDRISLPAQGIYGDVVDVGLRATRIRTRDHKIIVVPNSSITDGLIVNESEPDPRLRLDVPIGVAYGTDVDWVRDLLSEALRTHPDVLDDPPPRVIMTGMGASSVDFVARFWIANYADRTKILDTVTQRLYETLEAHRIEIPFPQQTIWHRLEDEALERWRRLFTVNERDDEQQTYDA